MKISAVIIAGNEELKIGDAIRSVLWADEVLVIDSESTDKTHEIAASFGARVIARRWPGFSEQKQFGADSAEHDWVLSLDADERVTPELQREIEQISGKESQPRVSGYRIPRLSYYMNRPIRHSGWYPDYQLRFFDRRRASWSKALVHESVKPDDGETAATLKGDLLHFSVESAAHHHAMIGERYAPLAARQMFESGRRTSRVKIMTAGLIAFFSTYILKLGILDGLPGFAIARFAGHHAFLKHLMLFELQNQSKVTTMPSEG